MLIADILRSERDALQKEIAELEPKQKRLSLVLELLKFYEFSEAVGKPFAGLTVSKAILKHLEGPEDHFATVVTMRDALLAGGIASDAERFATVVHMECHRLMKRGKVIRTRKDGKTGYQLRPVTPADRDANDHCP